MCITLLAMNTNTADSRIGSHKSIIVANRTPLLGMDESGVRPPALPPLGMVITVAVLALIHLQAAPAPRTPPLGRVVAITIDDLPATGEDWLALTTGLLAALKHHTVPAIGFVNERKLYVDGTLDSSRVALLRAWRQAGLELGNHTFAHRSANRIPLNEYLEGII